MKQLSSSNRVMEAANHSKNSAMEGGWIGIGIPNYRYEFDGAFDFDFPWEEEKSIGLNILFSPIYLLSYLFKFVIIIFCSSPIESFRDWTGYINNNEGRIKSRYIQVVDGPYYYVGLKRITVFSFFIGPIIGLIAGFEEGIFEALSYALLGVLLGYLTPFLLVGIKQWSWYMSQDCLTSFFFFFLAPFLIPIFTIWCAYKGISAILKRDYYGRIICKECRCTIGYNRTGCEGRCGSCSGYYVPF